MENKELTLFDYFEQLQMEYLSYKLRESIYNKEEFSKQSKDIAEKKKEKIINLSQRLGVLSVCDCFHIYEIYVRKFIQSYGLPLLQYNDNQQSLIYWDRISLFKEGESVEFIDGEEYFIVKNLPKLSSVIIQNSEREIQCPYHYISIEQMLLSIFFD